MTEESLQALKAAGGSLSSMKASPRREEGAGPLKVAVPGAGDGGASGAPVGTESKVVGAAPGSMAGVGAGGGVVSAVGSGVGARVGVGAAAAALAAAVAARDEPEARAMSVSLSVSVDPPPPSLECLDRNSSTDPSQERAQERQVGWERGGGRGDAHFMLRRSLGGGRESLCARRGYSETRGHPLNYKLLCSCLAYASLA